MIAKIAAKDFRGFVQVLLDASKRDKDLQVPQEEIDRAVGVIPKAWGEVGDFVDSGLYREEKFGERYVILTYV